MAVQFDENKGFTGWWTLFKKELPKVNAEIENLFNNSRFNNLTPSIMKDKHYADLFDDFKIKQEDREALKGFIKDYDKLGDPSGKFQKYLMQNNEGISAFSSGLKRAGSALKSFGASMLSMGATWFIGEVIGYLVTIPQKLEEARQATIELGKETAKTNKELDTLVAQYRKLGEDGKLDNSDREQAYDIQKQINELLEDEVGYINLANGEYEEQLRLLKDIQRKKAEDSVADIRDAKVAAEESLDGEVKYSAFIDSGLDFVDEIKAVEKVMSDEGFSKYFSKGADFNEGGFLINTKNTDTIIQSYEDMVKLRDVLVKSYEDEIREGGNLEDFYNNLVDKIGDMSDVVQKYRDAMTDYNLNEAVIQFNETEFDGITGAMINSEAAMTKWMNAMLTSGHVSSDIKSELASLARTWYPQYIAQIDKATDAQAKLSIRTKLHDKSIAGDIIALKAQATALGMTEKAMIELVLSEIKFSRNELNVSQKVSALKEVAAWAGVAQTKIDDEAIQNQIDNLGKVDIPETPYTQSGTSSSSSSSNDALDNYLHEAERRYKVHQNELTYISDLQYAYNNLTKTQEEQLDILDDIDEAYKDHAENQIKDIEHQMELLKNLYGEENVDLTPYYEQMQKIRENEANRLRAAGYDNNSNEVQEQQSGWWEDEAKKVDELTKQHEKTIRNLEHSMKLELEANPFADTTEFYKAMQEFNQ